MYIERLKPLCGVVYTIVHVKQSLHTQTQTHIVFGHDWLQSESVRIYVQQMLT